MNIITIVPAYNEEKTVADVIRVIKEIDLISKLVVVSDGSSDRTADIAFSMGADVIELKRNVGKGGAIKAALDKYTGDIILFLDADLIGLKREHVMDLLSPVINKDVDMSIGIFKKGRLRTDLAQIIAPYLSGQRAIRRSALDAIPNIDITRYGVEVAITRCFKKYNIKMDTVELNELSHYMKEEKLGLIKGLTARMKMYWDIVKCLMI